MTPRKGSIRSLTVQTCRSPALNRVYRFRNLQKQLSLHHLQVIRLNRSLTSPPPKPKTVLLLSLLPILQHPLTDVDLQKMTSMIRLLLGRLQIASRHQSYEESH